MTPIQFKKNGELLVNMHDALPADENMGLNHKLRSILSNAPPCLKDKVEVLLDKLEESEAGEDKPPWHVNCKRLAPRSAGHVARGTEFNVKCKIYNCNFTFV